MPDAPLRTLPPRVAMTLGDPGGIGPEILLKSLATVPWTGRIRPVVVGDRAVIDDVVLHCRLGQLRLRGTDAAEISQQGEMTQQDIIDVVDCHVLTGPPRYGAVTQENGAAAVAYIEKACDLVRRHAVAALVTGPISKEATWKAGSTFPGHTEMLTSLLGVESPEDVMTMFYLKNYKIFFLTRHLSLREAIAAITVDATASALHVVARHMRELGVSRPRIAVPALNPHAGENGKLGSEENAILVPAVERARRDGLDVTGPVAADAVFYQASTGRFDAVLSLFHDQGHIAAKTQDFFGTVTCQLGLPTIRTSVDHGTAFDIAGSWTANPEAQQAALSAAIELLEKRRAA
jgi:4-phospho-D-threonate 3-dehydrogenase / 4-phospho-D-erythronate 3-dehydrogenase